MVVAALTFRLFRDGKSTEEEIKAWQFWHQRQHSVSFSLLSYPALTHVLMRASLLVARVQQQLGSDKFIHNEAAL